MKLLEIIGLKPAVEVQSALIYFETKTSPMERIK